MTTRVWGIMLRAEERTLARKDLIGTDRAIAQKLLWDGWLALREQDEPDLRLTQNGKAWLMNARLRREERGL